MVSQPAGYVGGCGVPRNKQFYIPKKCLEFDTTIVSEKLYYF
jgi:hypothetical protein